jgi:hypothetical protein
MPVDARGLRRRDVGVALAHTTRSPEELWFDTMHIGANPKKASGKNQEMRRQILSKCTILVAITLLVLSACAPAPATPTQQPTRSPVPLATTAIPTPLPTALPTVALTPTPSLAAPWHPADARTGIGDIDRIIAAILAGDLAAKEALVSYTTTPCTTALGMGGPPKCQAGESDGTLVEVFPVLGQEGEYARRDGIARILDLTVKGLYAVYRVPADAYREEYWPAGDYGIVFVGDREGLTIVAHAAGGAIVRLDLALWAPAIVVARDAGELLLPPPGWKGTGTLEGHVTIGPLVPVAHQGTPEPTPWPEVWQGRLIMIYADDGQTEVTFAAIDAQGEYRVRLQAGTYVVDINRLGLDRGMDLPKKVEILSDQVTRLDVEIDTGLR